MYKTDINTTLQWLIYSKGSELIFIELGDLMSRQNSVYVKFNTFKNSMHPRFVHCNKRRKIQILVWDHMKCP